MKLNYVSLIAIGLLAVAASASADTFGNTNPFSSESNHAPNYVLGVQVTIPYTITLQSFGLIYGNNDQPAVANGMFALYSSDPGSGLPLNLVASTNGVNLNTAQTYDNIAFTSTPVVTAGTYWMMALYQTFANPRMDLSNSGSLVAYWSQGYGSFNATAPGVNTYTGQNFNYWVNGQAVPEPASLLAFAPIALGLIYRKRKA